MREDDPPEDLFINCISPLGVKSISSLSSLCMVMKSILMLRLDNLWMIWSKV